MQLITIVRKTIHMGDHSFKKSRWESNPLFLTMSPVLNDLMALPGVVETPSTVRQTIMLAITPWERIYFISFNPVTMNMKGRTTKLINNIDNIFFIIITYFLTIIPTNLQNIVYHSLQSHRHNLEFFL